MKKNNKMICIMLVLTLSASVLMGCGKTRKKEYAVMSPEESKEYNDRILQNMKNKDKGKKKIKIYSKDKEINAFITKYNKSAKYKIKSGMLSSQDVAVHGIGIGMKNGFTIRVWGERTAEDYFAIRFYLTESLGNNKYELQVMRDMCKTLDKSVTNKDFDKAVETCKKSDEFGLFNYECKKVKWGYGESFINMSVNRDFS